MQNTSQVTSFGAILKKGERLWLLLCDLLAAIWPAEGLKGLARATTAGCVFVPVLRENWMLVPKSWIAPTVYLPWCNGVACAC